MRRLCACRPCKPGSVPGANPGPLSFIWDGSLLPPRATYPPASGEQPLTAGIHGLATHGTYGRATSLPPRWALTPPFHPYPQSPAGGRSLLRSHNLTAVRPLACVALCVARTFLSRPRPAATERTCTAKVIKFGGIPASGGAIFGKCVSLLRTGRNDAVHAKFFGNIGLNSTFAKG